MTLMLFFHLRKILVRNLLWPTACFSFLLSHYYSSTPIIKRRMIKRYYSFLLITFFICFFCLLFFALGLLLKIFPEELEVSNISFSEKVRKIFVWIKFGRCQLGANPTQGSACVFWAFLKSLVSLLYTCKVRRLARLVAKLYEASNFYEFYKATLINCHVISNTL